jgi:hypothetical protein
VTAFLNQSAGTKQKQADKQGEQDKRAYLL